MVGGKQRPLPAQKPAPMFPLRPCLLGFARDSCSVPPPFTVSHPFSRGKTAQQTTKARFRTTRSLHRLQEYRTRQATTHNVFTNSCPSVLLEFSTAWGATAVLGSRHLTRSPSQPVCFVFRCILLLAPRGLGGKLSLRSLSTSLQHKTKTTGLNNVRSFTAAHPIYCWQVAHL